MENMDNGTIRYENLPPVNNTVNNYDLGAETALANRVNDLTKELEMSKANAEDWRNRMTEWRTKVDTLKNTLKDVLIELTTSQDIGQSQAQRIAEACELELTREVSFTGTISFSGTVEISLFEEFDRWELNPDGLDISYNGETVYDVDYTLEDAEENEYSY